MILLPIVNGVLVRKFFKQAHVMIALIYAAIRGRMAAAKHQPQTLTYLVREGKALALDLYLPEATADKPIPLLIWFHGGGWVIGSRQDIEKVIVDQVSRGYAVASVSYTLAETKEGLKTHWPVQCHEAKAAIRYLRSHTTSLGLDPDRFIACGMSAGAHMAAMVGGTNGNVKLDGSLGDYPGVSSCVQGVVAFYPPTDFESVPRGFDGILDYYDGESPVAKILGGPLDEMIEAAKLCSVCEQVQPGSPPFLLLHGDRDPIVPASQSEILEERLRAIDVAVNLRRAPGFTHGDFGFNKGEHALAIEQFLDELTR
jgi:acetyl esterase/lipase